MTRVKPIGIVGAGVLAQTLGRALVVNGASIVALASRTPQHAAAAADFIGGGVRAVDLSSLSKLSTHIVIATADVAIRPVADALAATMTKGVALHTCGACGLGVFEPLESSGVACGVMHPLQTFPAPDPRQGSMDGIHYAVAGDSAAVAWAQELVALLDGHAMTIRTEGLPLYHAGAALASNGIVALLDGALALFAAAGVQEREALDALAPLCRRSIENAVTMGPEAALTGPIVRGDVGTVRSHMTALSDHRMPQLPLYREIARALIDIAKRRGVADSAVRRLSEAIE